jgi:hypothetical protein
MAGFLSGLKDLLLDHDEYTPGATTHGAVPAGGGGIAQDLTLQAAPQLEHKQGLLSQGLKYLMSPEGRLTIGTTLRAGNGDENAFADQRAILSGNAAQARQAKADSDATAFQDAFTSSMVPDENGVLKFDRAAFAKKVAGLKGAIKPTDMVELMNSVTPKQVPVGKNIATIDPMGGPPTFTAAPLDEEDLADRQARRGLLIQQADLARAKAEAEPVKAQTGRISATRPRAGGGGGGGGKMPAALAAAIVAAGGSVED